MQQLGDQLIRNADVALLELVKNAYDADAGTVKVSMIDPDRPDAGRIIIEDDGVGMDDSIIRNAWLEIGSDVKETALRDGSRTKKYGRLPIGEKGIGRFGIHKLGRHIVMITRKAECKEVVLEIDWDSIAKTRYLEDFPIKLSERHPVIFTGNKTGTRIEISLLRNAWTEGDIKSVVQAIHTLHSPFETACSFHTNVSVTIGGEKPEYITRMATWKQIKEHALYQIDAEISGTKIKKFKYRFTPLSGMKKLRAKAYSEKDKIVADTLRLIGDKNEDIDLSKFHIGTIKFRAHVFSRELGVLKLGIDSPAVVKKYLDDNGGVRVFRDGMRVYDYGVPGNDWLKLDIERVNRPGKKLSNNLVIGAVFLDRAESSDLIEKTNREGFVEDSAFNEFRDAVRFVVDKAAEIIAIDRKDIRNSYAPTKKSEPVLSDIAELKKFAEKSIKDGAVKKKVVGYLRRIEDGYSSVLEILLRSSAAGLTIGTVLHEIEKNTKALKIAVAKEHISEHTLSLFQNLVHVIESYTILISKSDRNREHPVKQLIDTSLDACRFRFEAHKISIVRAYQDVLATDSIRCAQDMFMSALLNILDNSIWWLSYHRRTKRKIFIGVSTRLSGYRTVIVADNGPGFSLPTDQLTEPFVTTKPGGMGLGLHIVKEIMSSHDGLLLFPEKGGDFELPKEFWAGAVVALAFPIKKA